MSWYQLQIKSNLTKSSQILDFDQRGREQKAKLGNRSRDTLVEGALATAPTLHQTKGVSRMSLCQSRNCDFCLRYYYRDLSVELRRKDDESNVNLVEIRGRFAYPRRVVGFEKTVLGPVYKQVG